MELIFASWADLPLTENHVLQLHDVLLKHSLLLIAVFVVRFLAVHPFQDGNGRLARALSTLLLLRAGYAYAPYSSLERIVEDNRAAYYLALRRAQGSLDRGEAQLGEWLGFFLTCLRRQQEVLSRRLERERLAAPLPHLSEKLLQLARERGRLTVREATALTQANRNTVKSHLRRLVQAGLLAQRGRGRGAWYEPGR
ncbi:MAG: Fic family protein [Deltaproteobacteria bacterium]|nr:Fic family protein [Deltaproteobacteria bacterium]